MIPIKDVMLLMCVAMVIGGAFAWMILSAFWNHGAAW